MRIGIMRDGSKNISSMVLIASDPSDSHFCRLLDEALKSADAGTAAGLFIYTDTENATLGVVPVEGDMIQTTVKSIFDWRDRVKKEREDKLRSN